MDTSETYIKMCDCEEIQKLAWCTREMAGTDLCHHTEHDYWHDSKDRDGVWLPRQDQLQEMVNWNPGHSQPPVCLVSNLYDFLHMYYAEYTVLFTSMEQLWLAFVMKEKYNKVWNDGLGWLLTEQNVVVGMG